jgi:hypothetical protein
MMKKLLASFCLLLPLLGYSQTRTVGVNSSGVLTAPSNFKGTNFQQNNIIYCDPINGNDTTAQYGTINAYAGISNAFRAVVNNTTLRIRGLNTVGTIGYGTNAPLKLYSLTNVVIEGEGGAIIQAGGLGSLIAMGFCSNVVIRNLEFSGVLTNNQLGGQSGSIWIEGDSSDVRLENTIHRKWINQAFVTYRHPDAGWGYERFAVRNNLFEYVGFTNYSGIQPNDGTAVVVCGNFVDITDNYFRYNLRDIETFTHTDALPDQVWKHYRITGNISEGAIEEFLAQGATNVQNWVVANNVVKMYATNRTANAAPQKATTWYGGKNIVFANNSISGAEYAMLFKADNTAFYEDWNIHNNLFTDIGNHAIYPIVKAVGYDNQYKRIAIDNNIFNVIGGYAILGGFSDGSIRNNIFVDVGTNGPNNRVISFGTSTLADGGGFAITNSTNTTISGNIIVNSSASTAYTDGTIVVTDRAYSMNVRDNTILAGSAPVINSAAYGPSSRAGSVTLSSGLATVNTTQVFTNSYIFLQPVATANAVAAVCVTNRTAGTSFQIRSTSNTDGNRVDWFIASP